MYKTDVEDILKIIDSSSLNSLRESFYKAVIRYGEIREKWATEWSKQERIEMDQTRTFAHNAFISSCNALSRNMYKKGENVGWIAEIGNDRYNLGEFAVLIYEILKEREHEKE